MPKTAAAFTTTSRHPSFSAPYIIDHHPSFRDFCLEINSISERQTSIINLFNEELLRGNKHSICYETSLLLDILNNALHNMSNNFLLLYDSNKNGRIFLRLCKAVPPRCAPYLACIETTAN